MSSKFNPKDPKAVDRGRKSGAARKSKDSTATPIPVHEISAPDGDKIVLVNPITKESFEFQSNLPEGEIVKREPFLQNDFLQWRSLAWKKVEASVFKTVSRLRAKAKWFLDIKEAAKKQATAYSKAADALEDNLKVKKENPGV